MTGARLQTAPGKSHEGTLQGVATAMAGLTIGAIPEACIRTAKRSILDCLGVTLAARESSAARALRAYLAHHAAPGRASVVASDVRVTAEQAAWVNGTLAHVLDFDNTAWLMVGHPTAPVLPALLALAEERGLPGQTVLVALVAGIQFELWLGQGMAVRHYENGWQPTGTLGTLSAAAAAARLLGLGPLPSAMAIGIAASHASGLYCSTGTMTKALHVGNAARNGVVAAELAALDPPSDSPPSMQPGRANGRERGAEPSHSPSCWIGSGSPTSSTPAVQTPIGRSTRSCHCDSGGASGRAPCARCGATAAACSSRPCHTRSRAMRSRRSSACPIAWPSPYSMATSGWSGLTTSRDWTQP